MNCNETDKLQVMLNVVSQVQPNTIKEISIGWMQALDAQRQEVTLPTLTITMKD